MTDKCLNVDVARSKLDELLDEMVEKNDNSFPTDDDSSKINRGNLTPSKRGHTHTKTPRRKKKKDSLYEEIEDCHDKASYVIKIFDRRVDLAKYNEKTPLYVMVRDWMVNKPNMSNTNTTEGERNVFPKQRNIETNMVEESEADTTRHIHVLPAAVKQEYDLLPRPLPPALKTAFIEDVINTESDIDELRRYNMARWRKVKNRWKDHSMRKQNANLASLMILKQAFTPQTI